MFVSFFAIFSANESARRPVNLRVCQWISRTMNLRVCKWISTTSKLGGGWCTAKASTPQISKMLDSLLDRLVPMPVTLLIFFYFIAFSAPYMFGPTIRFGQMLQIKAKITITVGIVWVWNRFSIFIALICCSLVCLFNHVRSPLSFKMRFENYVFKCHHQITNAGCVH